MRIGDPSPRRDFTYVTDTARGFLLAATCDDAIGKTFNIGNGKSIAMGELATMICELTGGGTFVSETLRARPEKSEVSELLCDSSLALRTLGWRPEVTLEEGLRQTIAFIRQHPEGYAPDKYRV